jgi:hypothetical protein
MGWNGFQTAKLFNPGLSTALKSLAASAREVLKIVRILTDFYNNA